MKLWHSMRKRCTAPLPRATYANVTATLALFIALGGTSYAVATLPRNSVGEKQLRRGAVSTSKIRDGAVTASKLQGAIGSRGPRGEQGPPGSVGSVGPAGPVGPSEVMNVRRDAPVEIPSVGAAA